MCLYVELLFILVKLTSVLKQRDMWMHFSDSNQDVVFQTEIFQIQLPLVYDH